MITKDQRLSKSKRLIYSGDFKRVFQQGIKAKQGCLVTFTKLNGLGYARLGLAITKKAVPNATSRNQIKRIIRERFRLNQELLSGLDIVVLITSPYSTNKPSLLHYLDKQWSSLAVYYEKA